MTHKVGTKGQVVIPKRIREQIGIEPGDEVVFEPDGKAVRVLRLDDDPVARRSRIEALRGVWSERPGLSTKDLETERRKDRELEERKTQRLIADSP